MVDTTPRNNSLEDTLEDGAWMESFDKLLEPRPILRELNVLKSVVHASFNRDSSVENSVPSDTDLSGLLAPPPPPSIITLDNIYGEKSKRNNSISTPVANRLTANPFKCSLSPIGAWRLRYFDKGTGSGIGTLTAKETITEEDGPLHGTPINPEIIVADYDESTKNGSLLLATAPQQFSPLPLPQRCSEAKGVKRTRSQRHVCFRSVVVEPSQNSKSPSAASVTDDGRDVIKEIPQLLPSLALHSGKWQKPLSAWRRTQNATCRSSTAQRQSGKTDLSVEFVGVLGTVAGSRKSIYLKPERLSESILYTSNAINSDNIWECRVLDRCKQDKPMLFEVIYSSKALKYCKKIGEGAYGEVFLNAPNKRKKPGADSIVMKVIPIEGQIEVNGEVQKTYEQILSEVVITEELSKLRGTIGSSNITPCFVGVKKINCIKGKYPAYMIKLWEEYDKETGSENDHPEVFDETQIYLVLELEFGGRDLESFQFLNAEQAYYALQQIVLTLAVAEEAVQFEHRDLHWGNILLVNTNAKSLQFKLNNEALSVPTKGIKVTIIDYTLSRMTFNDCCHYNDLSCDEELFAATGDYQFEIYRMMRDVLKNNWENYEPRTNIFWISYIISKLCDGVKYKNTRTKTHTMNMNKLQSLMEIVLNFNSAKENDMA